MRRMRRRPRNARDPPVTRGRLRHTTGLRLPTGARVRPSERHRGASGSQWTSHSPSVSFVLWSSVCRIARGGVVVGVDGRARGGAARIRNRNRRQ